MNPGTSTKVMRGTLKASHVRTNRAPFSEASMLRTPASIWGWFPTMPTARPSIRANPQTRFMAQWWLTSKNSPSSTTASMTFFMS